MPESKEVVVVDPKEYGLQEKDVASISSAFAQVETDLSEIQVEYARIIKLEINDDTAKAAHELAKKAKKTNGLLTKIHKSQKDYFWQGGKFVDAWKNKFLTPLNSIRDRMIEIQEYKKRIERARLAALQEKRALELSDYMPYEDAKARNLSALEEDVFDALKAAKKRTFEDAEAEEKRIKDEQIEKERKNEVEKVRRDLLMPLSSFATSSELAGFADLSDEDFNALIGGLKNRRYSAGQEQEKSRLLDEREHKRRNALVQYALDIVEGEIDNVRDVEPRAFSTLLSTLNARKEKREKKLAEQAAENKRLKEAADLKEKEDAKAAKVEKAANAEASRRQVLFAKIGKTILFATCKAMSEEKFNANYTKLKADFDKEAKAESARKENEDAARQKEKTRLRNLEIDAANKAEADRIAAEDAEFNRQAELAKGDGQKMLDFINAIQELADRECNFTSKKYIKIKAAARIQLNNVISKIVEASK